MSDSPPIVLAMTGASGAAYGVRLLHALLSRGRRIELTISPAASRVFAEELGAQFDVLQFDVRSLSTAALAGGHWDILFPDDAPKLVIEDAAWDRVRYHHFQNWSAGIASGSFRTAGMVICPCSMGTLASIAQGLSTQLVHRAADVHLKERRKLVVVPRETPLGSIQLGNMKALSDAGAVVLPAAPGFYHRPQRISDLIDFVVARICDQLGVEPPFVSRWGE